MNCDGDGKHGANKQKDVGFAQIPVSSLRTIPNCKDIPENVLLAIAESSNYHLRQVIKYASQFMLHSGRSKLTTADINKALKWTNRSPLFGCTSNPFLKKKGENIIEDPGIEISSYIQKKETFNIVPPSTLTAQWIAVEGVPVSEYAVESEAGNIVQADKTKDIPSELLTYFEEVTSAVMSNYDPLVEAALHNLQRNEKICGLLSHFINFVHEQVRALGHDLNQIKKLFSFVSALTRNSFIYFGHDMYLSPLVHSILYCILEPQEQGITLAPSHWEVRDLASNLLKDITDRLGTSVNRLYENILAELVKVLKDLTKPLGTLYGAVVCICAFGPNAIEEALYPYMPELIEHTNRIQRINPIVSNETEKRENCDPKSQHEDDIPNSNQVEMEKSMGDTNDTTGILCEIVGAKTLHAALLHAAEIYLRSKMNSKSTNLEKNHGLCKNSPTTDILESHSCPHTQEKLSRGYPSLTEIYNNLFKYFGDTLVPKLFVDCNKKSDDVTRSPVKEKKEGRGEESKIVTSVDFVLTDDLPFYFISPAIHYTDDEESSENELDVFVRQLPTEKGFDNNDSSHDNEMDIEDNVANDFELVEGSSSDKEYEEEDDE